MDSSEAVYFMARVLTCGIWIAAGLYKITHIEPTTREMRGHGIPLVGPVLAIVIVLELMGSILLILDLYVWAVCIAWLIFMIPASYLYHFRFIIRERTIDFIQWIMFWKNVSIAGGLFALILLDTSRPLWLLN